MATTFYFQNAVGSPVEPCIPPSIGWSGVANYQSYSMYPERGASPMIVGRTLDFGAASAGYKQLDRQYISPPIKGTPIISGYASGFLQVCEFVSNDNVNQIVSCLRLCSRNGKTIRNPTGWVASGRGPITEFSVTTTYTNRCISSGATDGVRQLINPMTGQDGDRLVLEIGYVSTVGGITPQASARWGDGAQNCGIGQTNTNIGAGWFSIEQDLNFYRGMTSSVSV